MRIIVCIFILTVPVFSQSWSLVRDGVLQASPALPIIRRSDFAMAWVPDVGVIMHGGRTGVPTNTWQVLRDGLLLDYYLWQSPPSARSHHAMAWWPNAASLVMFGGADQSYALLGDTVIRGLGGIPPYAGIAPTPRQGHAMATHAGPGSVLLYGGRDITGLRSDTWVFDGTWIPQTPTGATPPPSEGHALAPSPVNGNIVLVCQGATQAETWEWDGQNWTRLLPTTSPPNSLTYSMALDPVRNRIVLRIGAVLGTPGPRTMEWDGQNWIDQSVPGSPPWAEMGAQLVFDEDAGVVTLFGGTVFAPPGFPSRPTLQNAMYRWRSTQGTGQSNGIVGLDVNAAVGSAALPGPWTVQVRSNATSSLSLWGPSGGVFVLALGPALDPGVSIGPAGILNIGTPPLFQDILVIADGTTSPFFTLPLSGPNRLPIYLPPLPAATNLGRLQAYIIDVPGNNSPLPLLTAAFDLITN